MHIRHESPADIHAVRTLVYRAFINHPHHEPGATPIEHDVVDRLRERGELELALVAERDGQLVGHIAFSPVTINGEDHRWLGLAPVAVHPDHQHQGIGSRLIHTALKQLKATGFKGFVLLGDPAYYRRFGFEQNPALTFPGVPAEYFQALPCTPDIPRGEVAFTPAFP